MKLQISSRLAIFALLQLAADPERQLSAAEIGRLADEPFVPGNRGVAVSDRDTGEDVLDRHPLTLQR